MEHPEHARFGATVRSTVVNKTHAAPVCIQQELRVRHARYAIRPQLKVSYMHCGREEKKCRDKGW